MAWKKLLTNCPNCWQAIDDLREKPPNLPTSFRGPFTSLFATLITEEPRHANHRRALSRSRTVPHGLYWLLLEETAVFLPTTHSREGHRALELFHGLLDKLPPSPQRQDLEARHALGSASLWLKDGFTAQAREAVEQARRHQQGGTGDEELLATLQVAEVELTNPEAWLDAHLTDPSLPRAFAPSASDLWQDFTEQILDLVADMPERQVELLLRLGQWFARHDVLREAFQRLAQAEALAEAAAAPRLPDVQRELLAVETALSYDVKGRYINPEERLLFRCLAHHHERCLHPGEGVPLFLMPQQPADDPIEDFSALCLALAGGHEVPAPRWEEAGRRVVVTSDLEAFFLSQLDCAIDRFWDCLGQGPRKYLLAPMTHWLMRFRAFPEWPQFLTKPDPLKPLGPVDYRPDSSSDPS